MHKPNADSCHLLLLLCMKLCESNPEDAPSAYPMYTTAKRLCAAAEMAGYISVRLVQSFVLVAIYELSHGLHSAAFLTIGHAGRLSVLALGLPTYDHGQNLFKKPETWTQWEERRRTWWAIFLLDRFVQQPLVISNMSSYMIHAGSSTPIIYSSNSL